MRLGRLLKKGVKIGVKIGAGELIKRTPAGTALDLANKVVRRDKRTSHAAVGHTPGLCELYAALQELRRQFRGVIGQYPEAVMQLMSVLFEEED